MGNGEYVPGSYWFYAPNKGAAIFFLIAYAASTVIHLWQCYRYKYFKVTGLFVFCGLLFVAGFSLRVYASFGNYDNLDTFIASICLVYASPPLLELANYHILGRVLYYVPYLSPIHPGRVLSTFGLLSMIIECLNGWGASYSANMGLSGSSIATGHALMRASLALQLVVITCFLVLAGLFHRRCAKAGLGRAQGILQPMATLYASVGLILVRTVYRAVEHFGLEGINWTGLDPSAISPVIRYEWFFYVFEATLMLVNVWMWNVRHPRRYLPSDLKVYLARDGVTEVTGPGWQDPRPFLITVVDPLDIVGLFRGSDKTRAKFWENDGSGNVELA
ncbi:hypothetical protein ACRALDRAFT_2045148 [Sodiomyces alcalophilus JCM 7366]|uniref:uncharacterized protein n=1 Tax=Sodiomyces alcalophilus JCM 7366 TaxID=591952 RepID=UPI0039B46D57